MVFKLFEEPFISGIEVHDDLALVVPLSHCNLKCPHCHVKKIMNRVVKEYTVQEFFEMLRDEDCLDLTICFTGGDPLLYTKELDEFQEYIYDYKLKVVIETNGIGFKILPTVRYWYIDVKAPLLPSPVHEYVGVNITFGTYYNCIRKLARAYPLNSYFRMTLIDGLFDSPEYIVYNTRVITRNLGDRIIINQGNVSDEKLEEVLDFMRKESLDLLDIMVFSKNQGWYRL